MWTGPSPARDREAGGWQLELERGNLGPRDGSLYQTVSRLPVANQDFWDSGWLHLPGGLQPEISSLLGTQGTPERARPLRTKETKRLGWGR